MNTLLRTIRVCNRSSPWLRNYCTGKESAGHPLRKIRDMMFGKYLLWTNTLSAAGLMFLGDIACQQLEYKQGIVQTPCDWVRLGQMSFVGGLQGPLTHYFYAYLERLMPKVTIANVSKKILLDQLILSPVCIVAFFVPASLLEGKSWKESQQELLAKFITVYTMDWVVWPGAQFINFYFVKTRYRVLYVNVVTMVYNVFLSYIKHQETTHKGELEKEPEKKEPLA